MSALDKVEKLAAKLSGGGGSSEEQAAQIVADYDAYYSAHVQPFVDTCAKLEGTKNLGEFAETCFKATRVVLEASAKCKKPDQAALLKVLAPVVKVLTDMDKHCIRGDWFNHQKAFAEMIQCMNWMMIDLPRPHIAGTIEAADFYLTKILTTAKDKPDDEKQTFRDYVKQMKTMINELASFAAANAKTGIAWNPKGVDLSEFNADGAAPAAAPAAAAATVTPKLGDDIEARLEALCVTLEKAIAAASGGGDDDAGAADGEAKCLPAWDEYYKTAVQPFIDTCNKLDGTKNLGDMCEKAFGFSRTVFRAAAASKKPEDVAYLLFLQPIVDVLNGMDKACVRGDWFNHQKAFAEMIMCQQWFMMPLPKPHVMGTIEAADFYLTKILTTAKDKPDDEKQTFRDYVKQMKAMVKGLGDFVGANFKTGMEWNNLKGAPLADFKA